MEDAEDKFFNGYLRRNMAKIVTTVKVRELVPHLPSLTQSDRENIEAKRESTGNYNAMQLLLSSLRHKDNWLEEFISALKTCEHSGFASQIQEEYKSLKIQPNVSALAPMAPMSGGTLQPPLDLSTVSTPKMDEAVDVALSLPPEAAPGDGILANHTGPSSVVVSSQSPAEPAASVQTHTTEDIGAVTPTSHISSPAVPSPSPQVPAVEPIQDANPKLQSASDKSADTSKSSVGQVLAQGLHLSPVLGSPTEEVAGVMASLNEQDVTDGLISPSCVGRASAGEEVCSNKPVLLTSIHSVQVHQPFDSPSTFPPIPDQGAYSDDTVNLECSSSLSHHTSESVNAENIALSDAKKVSPGDAENVTLCDARKVDTGEESSIALSDTEKGASGDAESLVLSEAENVAPGDAESIVLSDAEKVGLSQPSGVTLSDTEMVVPGDTQNVAQGDAESEPFSEINAARVAPEEFKNVALCGPERVAPGDVESEALSDAERVAPGYAKGVTFSEKEIVTPHDVEGVFSGEKSATGTAVESFQPENKNTVIPSNGDGIGDADSTTPENRQNVVSDKDKVVIVNAESLVSENAETIPCDKLEGSSLEHPESRAEKNYCYSAHPDITTSSHNPESVIHDIVGPSNTQNRAADIMENTAPDSMESAPFIALEPTDPHLPQNVLKENDCDIAQQEISSPDAPSSNHNSESFFPGEADNGVSGEGDSRAPDGRDSGDQVDSESGGPAEGHSEASCDEDSGDTESEAPGEEDNGASSNVDDGAPGGRDNGASGDKDGGASGGSGPPGGTDCGAPGNGDSGTSGEGDSGSSKKGDSGDPGEKDNGAPGDGGSYTTREADSGGPQEEDNGESANRDSGVPGTSDSMIPGEGKSGGPGEGDNVIPGEGESREPEVRNIRGPGEGEIGGPAGGDSDTPGGIVSRVPNEVCIVVPSCTELPENNTGNQDSNHLEANLPASLSNHIPKSIVPSDVESATESTHKELTDNPYNSTHLEISLPTSALSNYSQGTFSSKDVEGRISGNTEPLHLETEENHCDAFHLKIGLSSEESFFPNADSASPNNMGSQSPGDTTSNKETVENHRSSTHLTINLTSPASLNKKPDSAAYVDMESHIHKPIKNHCSAPCCDITDEQDVDKKKLCMSEDLAPQNHTVSGETAVGVITEKLEAFPEQGQLNQRSPLGNYYVPAAVVGVVAAAMLWQLKK
ncbi:uncharacterized protein LOC135259621 isoform X2 [Anguilla rostrata]